MAKKIDPKLIEILTKYGEDPEQALWDCHGTWVAYHKAIERIAAKAGVAFDMPQIVEADAPSKVATIVVRGTLGDRSEWSFGEAAPNNNKNSYPFAMAEKRAKDRVVLKLIGLHGLVYSEEESDDFEPINPNAAPPPKSSASLKRSDENGQDAWDRLTAELYNDLLDAKTMADLAQLRADYRAKARDQRWPRAWLDALANEFDQAEDKLQQQGADDDFPGDTDVQGHPVMAG